MGRADWWNVLLTLGGWLLLGYAALEISSGDRIRDGVYYENIFPGFACLVATLGYAGFGLLLARDGPLRWGLVPVGVIAGFGVVTHRLFLS